MEPSNATIAELLRRYAAVLTLEGADRFKLKAYRRAAETIEGLGDDVAKRVQRGSDLRELPGIGKAISQAVVEIVNRGNLARLNRSLEALSPEMAELATRPALDPKKVSRVYKQLGINSLEQLRNKLDAGVIRDKFGARMDFHVRRGLDERPRHLLWSIEDVANGIENYLRHLGSVENVSAAGSLRRKQDTVGDLNFLVTGKTAASIFREFSRFGAVKSSDPRGRAERIFRLSSGIRVSLRWTKASAWGLALIEATGSAAHLAEMDRRVQAKKLTLTLTSLAKARIDPGDEKAVYKGLGLQWIEPELREGRGEVAAAAKRKLPRLVEVRDLRGDLHMHTTASDGANSIQEMVAAARKRGYEYMAITDHSQSLKITNGLSEKRLLQHIKAIDKINAKLKGFRILKSAEVDILEDGRLDYSNAVLKQLDLTICSIHSRFALNREQQTERILRAMDNPYFNILGHATGRLLLKREGYELDFERIMHHAKETGCLFEINSSPDRLDLSDEHARHAKDAGITIAVNTDAHSIGELDFISAGINQARRAWLSAADVLNTRPLAQMLALLRR
jgi:DNA polymerase (family 10)